MMLQPAEEKYTPQDRQCSVVAVVFLDNTNTVAATSKLYPGLVTLISYRVPSSSKLRTDTATAYTVTEVQIAAMLFQSSARVVLLNGYMDFENTCPPSRSPSQKSMSQGNEQRSIYIL